MDHLPYQKNGVGTGRAVVPYVCLKDYDGGPFLTYPIREGVLQYVDLTQCVCCWNIILRVQVDPPIYI